MMYFFDYCSSCSLLCSLSYAILFIPLKIFAIPIVPLELAMRNFPNYMMLQLLSEEPGL
jgi:hypothetical protein